MSELKAFNSERIYWAVEQVERVAGDIDTLHLDDSQFYLKSEADKVIEEKDKEIEELDDCIRDYSEKTKTLVIANLDMQRREDRQKYKRCLVNAESCLHKAWYYDEVPDRKATRIMWKWRQRWLAIAEKFKTNSTAQ